MARSLAKPVETDDGGRGRSEAIGSGGAIAAGLCATCLHQEDCVLQEPQSATQFCEEFEAEGRATRAVLTEVPAPGSGLLGLCATCEAAPECRLRPPEGGVWCCEEFA